ncbi:acetyltransferase (GNAT) family protein [Tamaricihabitans halophyticus]|uniref:Acetyltransferase (GNAT) family protein n=1 Tax=Tamaricihabitans halophyticus TaxID=1262583 RepID=A0A4R2QGH6_9PSEU|nr:GNAT family N-acetyltransferase [Tamaricihabitans halophyticus]TCP47799.1 acetyltransferase (GNAT) family protein [Tamaricihabitans halophyticus]
MSNGARALLEAQAHRFASLDALLPGAPAPPEGDVLTAALDDGRRVAGLLLHSTHDEHQLSSLWSARRVWELHPLTGDTGRRGMDALLRAWRGRLDRTPETQGDTACVITWPSRDIAAARALLDHGMVPLSVLAIRTEPAPEPDPSPVTVRLAEPDDLAAVVDLTMIELHYSALVGPSTVRANAAELKRDHYRHRLEREEPVWLAERDGVPVGIADCTVSTIDFEAILPRGRWGHVNTVSTHPDVRGGGVGRRLMAQAHIDLQRRGVRGSYLYYNLANPLSSVFWPQQHYRPLWTIWEARPASALR